ncbi:MAG: hypothetical protein AUK07_01790 [Parcubacteria group bacterium CG2_30_36_21]|nr:MAG: hypothetical protein AUK07_01790 [Parcubacteria group bacterium CG2_30_36_21]
MNRKIKIFFKIVVLITCLIGVSFLGYKVGVYIGEKNILKTPPPQIINQDLGAPEKLDFSIFWEAWREAERNFLEREKINPQEMIYGAISGMIDSLGDPYTNFFKPEEAKEFEEQLSGEYQGVGMIVGIKDEQLTIISPFEGSPAQKAGLKTGDKIIKIEDTYTKDISVEKAVELIKGSQGTTVKLLIQRKDWEQPKEIEVKREVIKIPTLEWKLIDIPEGYPIALIKIHQFNQILNSEFKKASFEILDSEADRIILDLRNNPGGYLEVAQDIAGWFLERGKVVVWEDEGEGKERKSYESKGPATFVSFPVVVLINQGSASGAEILAGALRDQRGIKLVGETSFGKGSVQKPIILSDNSYLKVTIAKWLTPNGVSIDEKGLEPDNIVEMTEEDYEEDRDLQLDKAIEVIRQMR